MDFKPRAYQRAATTSTIEDLKAEHKMLANILPTGAGKTEVMAMTAMTYLKETKNSILILSHLSDLTRQTKDRFQLRAPGIALGILQGIRRPGPMSRVVISTMQTARQEKRIQELKSSLIYPIGLIMVDETHMIGAQSYDTIRAYFPEIPVIGYTATPFREKKIMTSMFDKISFTISLQELIEQKYLVAPDVKEIVIQHAELPNPEIMNVVGLYKTHEMNRKAVVYMRTIDDAKLLRNAFEEIGVKARAVTSDVTGEAREAIYDDFREGETSVLCTVDVLTAGFDAPCIEAIFMPFGTKSPTQYLQRIGRGLRPFDGKKSCRVYMLGDAPTVSNKIYEKMNRIALLAGSSKREFQTFTEEHALIFRKKSDEIYLWTKQVVELVERLERLGMKNFAECLDHRKFPAHFMQSIQALIKRLPKNKRTRPHGEKPASDSQKSLLFESGFPSDILTTISKNEASMMISAIFNSENSKRIKSNEFIVKDGNYKGRHISEVPYKYRAIILKSAPDSPVAQLITAWQSRKRRA